MLSFRLRHVRICGLCFLLICTSSTAIASLGRFYQIGAVPGAIGVPSYFASTELAASFIVTNTNNSGPGSLRQAILDANASVGTDLITFSIGSGLQTIAPASSLPEISDPVVIDGTTQPGFAGSPLIELSAINITSLPNQSVLNITAGNTTVRGLIINHFTDGGISILTAGANHIEGTYIGTDSTGSITTNSRGNGITLNDSPNNVIGGTTLHSGNVISALNSNAISIFGNANGNLIQGNYIGTNAAGTTGLGNFAGIFLGSSNNIVGGTTPEARNVISANDYAGIVMQVSGTSGNLIQGNYVGTNAAGNVAIGNNNYGIVVFSSSHNNTIGGTSAGAGNVVSANGWGIGIVDSSGTPSDNVVQGNFVGVGADGSTQLGNRVTGVLLGGALNTTVGGVMAGAGNTIAFNGPTAGIGIGTGVDALGGSGNSIRGNSIFSNGRLGIDLDQDGVTSNDFGDGDSGGNNLQNFPVLTQVTSNAGSITIQGSLNSSPNASFQIDFYSNAACDSSGNGEGAQFLGTMTVTTDGNGDVPINASFPIAVTEGKVVTATATDSLGNTSEFSLCQAIQGGFISFSQANYTIGESGNSIVITVNRTNDLSGVVTVDYATTEAGPAADCSMSNGFASSRCDFTTALGTLGFAAGETSKTFIVLISQDNFVEGSESLTLTLSNLSGAAIFATPSTATLTITDDATEPPTNPIDDASNFVRQHYHDFLNREPDAGGLAFWTNQITDCGSDEACIQIKRINVSAAFFLSIEFQETGYLVERLYKSAYGDATGTSNFGPTHQLAVPIVRFNEFLPDTQQIGNGVVIGEPGADQLLESNKQAFIAEFVQRTRFTTAYPDTLTPAQFVDALFANTGVTPSDTERTSAIDEFGGAGTSAEVAARARALRKVAENASFKQQEVNKAFVLMQYFGYLRRNPNDPQDTDYSGYDFWLTKLNQFGGNFVNADMVKAFIVSSEYRARFGP